MRRAGTALVLAALLAAVAVGAHAAPAPFTYVALGDSFSSGEGVAPYLGAATTRCDRSTRAYAAWVRPRGFDATVYALASGGGKPGAGNRYGSDANVRSAGPYAWSFWACSGARTRQALDGAMELENADLVTLTMGGNDAGYVDVLVQCGLSRCNTAAFRAQRAAKIDALKPALEATYRAIGTEAPHARILVLGYAPPFPATRAEQSCVGLRLFAGEEDMLRALGVRLNGTIASAVADVAEGGVNIAFVPVAARFAGHEVCGRKGAWMTGIKFSSTGFGLDPGSFHPNLKGQRDGYGAAVNGALR
jgi:lysophospholipase L1-like esterase